MIGTGFCKFPKKTCDINNKIRQEVEDEENNFFLVGSKFHFFEPGAFIYPG